MARAKATVSIDLDQRAVARLATDASYELAKDAADRVQDLARAFAPKRTGALAASIEVQIVGAPGLETTFEVGSPLDYAVYQEFGTGPIHASPGKVLSFTVGGTRVFAMRTSGVPATHFMRRALNVLKAGDFD